MGGNQLRQCHRTVDIQSVSHVNMIASFLRLHSVAEIALALELLGSRRRRMVRKLLPWPHGCFLRNRVQAVSDNAGSATGDRTGECSMR